MRQPSGSTYSGKKLTAQVKRSTLLAIRQGKRQARKTPAISLFTGAGGMGFSLEGFDIRVAVETDAATKPFADLDADWSRGCSTEMGSSRSFS
jgi:hypothetical protein